jgi:hypothetical protein
MAPLTHGTSLGTALTSHSRRERVGVHRERAERRPGYPPTWQLRRHGIDVSLSTGIGVC